MWKSSSRLPDGSAEMNQPTDSSVECGFGRRAFDRDTGRNELGFDSREGRLVPDFPAGRAKVLVLAGLDHDSVRAIVEAKPQPVSFETRLGAEDFGPERVPPFDLRRLDADVSEPDDGRSGFGHRISCWIRR